MKPKTPKTLKELQEIWYQKLRDKTDFVDIEDTTKPDRPLKEWHSSKFQTHRSKSRQAAREAYDKMMDRFLNSKSIDEICELIVKHGNSSIGPKKVKQILEFHRNGLTHRAISKKIKCGQKCVHITLRKAKAWMKLAS